MNVEQSDENIAETLRYYARYAGYVYIVEAAEINRVKIGMSAKLPGARIRQIQHFCPVKLQTIAILSGGIDLEKAFHGRFHALRRTGEWFEPNDELRRFMTIAAAVGREQTMAAVQRMDDRFLGREAAVR